MKLLKGQTEIVEDDGIKISVKVIDTATQAAITDMSAVPSIEGRIRMIGYMLRNIIESVEIKGEKYTPNDLATKADISDDDTLTTFLKIGNMVMGVVYPSSAEEKK